MNPLNLLNERRSVPSRLLSEPGPTPAQTRTMLEAAMCVPDHGRLAPWRFLVIEGESRRVLGERVATRAVALDPHATAATLDADRQRFLHAPLVVAVIATPVTGHKVPVVEQLLSGGAVCFALLQAAHGLGFGAQWLTGWAAYDAVILGGLGLAGHEQLLGFIHIGTTTGTSPERPRPRLDDKHSDWTP